jgi:hypothetical protein
VLTLTSTPEGAIEAAALIGPADSTSPSPSTCVWRGLKISADKSKITIDKDSPAAIAVPVVGEFTVKGTVTIGTTVTPVAQNFTVILYPEETPTIRSIAPLKLNTGEVVDETILVESSGGTIALDKVEPKSWNGLQLSVSGSEIRVEGRPLDADSRKFTATGAIGHARVTTEFSITAAHDMEFVPMSDEFEDPSVWKKERAGTRYSLAIPLKKAFIAEFDANKDGKLTTDELATVLPAVKAPNAVLAGAAWKITGNTLYVNLEFSPKKDHSRDWDKDLSLEALTVIGKADAAAYYTFEGGVDLEEVPDIRGEGGGCSAGASSFLLLLALPLLEPLALRLRGQR